MARPRGSKTIARASDLMQILERQRFRCALSGRELTPDSASIDHITPLAKGGPHELGNIWVVENTINKAKNTMTPEEFVAMCRDVVNFADQQHQNEVA
jgi:5-methylcytosine-specific restriction endonuclease McrA